ncbi:MAG TPA: hypothetical protein VG432_10485 [Gemmatimonadaceae bacterium]|nr:hypothetical protein [Gemmatimonadaceae bacterium]
MFTNRRAASLTAATVLTALGAFACEKAGSAHEAAVQTARPDTTPARASIVPERCATMPANWTLAVTPKRLLPKVDSVRPAAATDTAVGDTSAASRSGAGTAGDAPDTTTAAGRAKAKARVAAAKRDSIATERARLDTFPTPPTPLPGSVLPGCRVVAYYGNPLSKRMGILGELPVPQMLARLEAEAHAFERADTTRPVVRALEMITPVAQGSPGSKGLWRTRMADTLIENMAKLAESKGYLFILDVQVGKSTVPAELEALVPYLKRPYVHLALDPEFSMKGKEPPGKKIGTMDAADVNAAIALLAKLVDENKLPPKLLIVHRFTQSMLTNHEKITRDPRVQVIIDMDGFGPPHLKLDSYRAYVHKRPVQYFGIKLFYKNDKPRFTAEEVMQLFPIPQYIQFQ